MKKLIMLFSFLMVTSLTMAQKGIEDTSEMCMPYSVAQKILLDLNDYDRVKQINIFISSKRERDFCCTSSHHCAKKSF